MSVQNIGPAPDESHIQNSFTSNQNPTIRNKKLDHSCGHNTVNQQTQSGQIRSARSTSHTFHPSTTVKTHLVYLYRYNSQHTSRIFVQLQRSTHISYNCTAATVNTHLVYLYSNNGQHTSRIFVQLQRSTHISYITPNYNGQHTFL